MSACEISLSHPTARKGEFDPRVALGFFTERWGLYVGFPLFSPNEKRPLLVLENKGREAGGLTPSVNQIAPAHFLLQHKAGAISLSGAAVFSFSWVYVFFQTHLPLISYGVLLKED